MCGTCCYGEGGIVLEQGEVERISEFIGIASRSFISEFCEERGHRLTIRTGVTGFCIFYKGKGECGIHPVKPSICTLWPFYPANIKDKITWKMAKEACPGINPDCPFEEFVRQAQMVIA